MRASVPVIIAMAAVAVLWAGLAAAQSARLNAAEARAELFGVRLIGVHEPLGQPWEECIEPSGRTVYRVGDAVTEGRLVIAGDGAACFAYASDGFRNRTCFVVLRESENYRFGQFVTQRVERGVTQCVGGEGYVEAPSARRRARS